MTERSNSEHPARHKIHRTNTWDGPLMPTSLLHCYACEGREGKHPRREKPLPLFYTGSGTQELTVARLVSLLSGLGWLPITQSVLTPSALAFYKPFRLIIVYSTGWTTSTTLLLYVAIKLINGVKAHETTIAVTHAHGKIIIVLLAI